MGNLSFAPPPVAQLDRAPGFEPGCREFESLRAGHIRKHPLMGALPYWVNVEAGGTCQGLIDYEFGGRFLSKGHDLLSHRGSLDLANASNARIIAKIDHAKPEGTGTEFGVEG